MTIYEYGKSSVSPLIKRPKIPKGEVVDRHLKPQQQIPTSPTQTTAKPELQKTNAKSRLAPNRARKEQQQTPVTSPQIEPSSGQSIPKSTSSRGRRTFKLPDPAEWRPYATCEDEEFAERFKQPEYREWSIEQCDRCRFFTKCLAQTISELKDPSKSDILDYDVRAGYPLGKLAATLGIEIEF